jgi:RimJ/RimL family protein N-acetyltransferase
MSQPDFQPTLLGPSITIRPITTDDWPELFAAGSDPKIWEVHPVPDRYTEAEFRKFFDGAVKSKMGFVFVDRATGRLIGSSRYYGYAPSGARSRSAGPSSPAAIGAAPPTARSSA